MQCPKEGCDGETAAFFQVQIRSADEPMTGFYKVRLRPRLTGTVWLLDTDYNSAWLVGIVGEKIESLEGGIGCF
jgi:hypothetical protein